MKKLSSIDRACLVKDTIFINRIDLNLGSNIDFWLKEFVDEKNYLFDNYSKEYDKLKRVEFKDNNGIIFYLENGSLTEINIYPYQFDSSPYFKGEIYIEDKLLEVPFKSDDIEKYFPNAETPRKVSKVMDRFQPRDWVICPIDENTEIELSIGRDPRLVSAISLKKRG